MDALRDLWNDLDGPLVTFASVVLIVLVATVLQRSLRRVLRRSYLARGSRSGPRQQTLVSLLESLVRYAVYGAALVVIVGLVTGGSASAFFGASVVAVVIGFSFQRLLADVIAGALLLFENQFAIGDLVRVDSHDVTGVVEEFSLRTTSLRTEEGDLVTVLNGSIQAFTRLARVD